MQSVNWKPPFNPTDENVLRACHAVDPNWLCIHGQGNLREMLNGPNKRGSYLVNSMFGIAILCAHLPNGARAHDKLHLYNPNHEFEIGPNGPALYVRHGDIGGCVAAIEHDNLVVTRIGRDKKTEERHPISFADLSASLKTSHEFGRPGGIRYLPVTYNDWLQQMKDSTFEPPV